MLSRRLDKVEDIDWENFKKLFWYYGHSYVFVLYIIMEILILYLRGKTKYLIGSWAEVKTKQDDDGNE